ncbi:hypothetical protein H4219_001970 [Mycoemilia scoparia]|uniref:HPP transmembrane region domain-containing protein n=1 Tax=Mycoemilia scoparia TaxID=417184 RepID=A0A9W7ZZ27_9FUNG|nr:hypothetical protein H4219_001970 [Mycoemilia scoparia]
MQLGAPWLNPEITAIGGHLVSGLAGTIVAHIFKNTPRSLEWLPGALAVAFAIVAMDITGTTHPPGGATAYIAVTGGPLIDKVGWWYPLFPVLAGSLVMFAVAMIVNNVLREYPVYWWGPSTPPPPTPPPIEPLPDTSPLSSSEKPTPQYNDGPESFKIPDGSPRENYHPLDMDSKSLESRPIKTHSGSSNTNLVKSLSSQDSETGNIFVTAGAAAAWAKEKKELLSIIHKLEEEVRCLRNSNN